jgi:hypothetical protein
MRHDDDIGLEEHRFIALIYYLVAGPLSANNWRAKNTSSKIAELFVQPKEVICNEFNIHSYMEFIGYMPILPWFSQSGIGL